MADLEKMLSRGSVRTLMSGEEYPEPVLKVLGHRKVPGGGPQDRYRLLLTDGIQQHSFVMLGTQLNYLVEEDQLPPGTILRVTKHVLNNMKSDKPIFIVISLDILGFSSLTEQQLADTQSAGGGGGGGAVGFGQQQPTKPLADNNWPAAAAGNSGGGATFSAVEDTPPRPTASARPAAAATAAAAAFVPQTPPHGVARSAALVGAGSGSDQSGGSGIDTGRVRPISTLNPYQSKWTVCGRVTQKSQIRTWSNSRGDGKLFSFVLTDDSSEIRITAFRDEVDKFFDLVEVGRAFYVSKGQLKAANRQFNTTQNEYEMVLGAESQLQICEDTSAAAVPELKYTFVLISQLDTVEPNKFADICGVVHETHECQTIKSRTNNRDISKRDLTLVDDSGCSVRCTLWGDEAVNFNGDKKPVVVIKGAKVSDFHGRSLSVSSNSSMQLNPSSVPAAIRLRGWYQEEGHQMQFDTFRGDGAAGGGGGAGRASYRNLKDCKASGFGTGDRFEYFSCLACVIHVKRETCLYQACPKADCNKKVVEFNGEFRCEKCQASYPNFIWRFLLQANLADFSDNQWVTCFQETAEKLLGLSAAQLGQMRTDGDEAGQAAVFERAMFQHHLFTMRAKMENFQDETRLRVVVQDVKPFDFVDASRLLIGQIEAMSA